MIRSTIVACCLAAFTTAGAQTFSESFDQGIPSSFKIYDLDGLTPNQSMTGLGFKAGKGWVSYTLKDVQGSFAASTSKYEVPGTSDDWLVTPEISVPSKGFWLEWKAMSCSKTSKAGYKVLVSVDGAESGDFTEVPVFEKKEEESEWSMRYVSLDRYEGKKIYVAFVNNSTDRYLLGIDDIKVEIPERIVMIASTTPSYLAGSSEISVSGKIRANYSQAIHSFTATYKSGDKTEMQEFTGLTVEPGEEYEFTFDKKLPASLGDTVKYVISVNIGSEEHSAEGKTVCYSFVPRRQFVLEEGTGTWCGYCTAGHVALDYIREKYPDEVIPVAVHNADPMTVKIYDSGLYSLGVDGYPIGFFNRAYKSQPMGRDMTPADGGWETAYLNIRERLAPANLEFDVEYTSAEQNEVTCHTKATFALNLPKAKYNLAYVVKECNVKGTTVKYNQNNYYSGSDKPVGGFEKLPVSVPASVMVYQDVARAIRPSFKGDVFIDRSVRAGEEIDDDYILALPNTILNKENVSFVVLLLDSQTGEVVNAHSFSFNAHEHEGLATSIDTPVSDQMPIISTCKNGGELSVKVKRENASDLSSGIYDLNGRCLSGMTTGDVQYEHSFVLPINGLSGVYLLKVIVGEQVFIRKVIF